MDKKQFEGLRYAAEEQDHETGTIAANKILNKALGADLGKIDINKVQDAHSVITKLVGPGELGGKIGSSADDESIATWGTFTGEGKTFAAAFLNLLIVCIKAKALDQFLAEPAPAKERSRADGLGSPAPARGFALRGNY